MDADAPPVHEPSSFPDAATRLVGLLGFPVSHSLSPRLHNAAFRADGLNWAYVALPVRPECIEAAVRGLGALGFAGANVTIPHKEAAARLCDRRSEGVEATGAANTIVVHEDARAGTYALTAHNTDIEGFLNPLRPHAERLRGAEAVLFGAGGAARAVAYALLTALSPSRLTLVARRSAQAEHLAADLAAYDDGALAVTTFEDAAPAVRRAGLLVNATPLGMKGQEDGTPWERTEDFAAEALAYDLIYTPRPTRFLRDAAARGLTTLDGWAMLVEQAAAAYRLWTGRPMPRDAQE